MMDYLDVRMPPPTRGCTTSADSLRLPFTCALADGRPLAASLPERPSPSVRTHKVEWSDVAAGIMLNNGVLREGSAAGGRAGLERALLLRSRGTWMPQASGLDILLLASCPRGSPATSSGDGETYERAPSPSWFPADAALPTMHWRCFRGRERLGSSLWRKTGALLTVLHRTFPAKRLFLKIDSDTMLMPRALLAFLRALHGSTPRGVPLYFGSNRISSKRRFCSGRACLLSTPQWRALAGGNGSSSSESDGFCESREASYAQGGAYGFDRRALAALVGGECLDKVASAVRRYDGATDRSFELFEDEAVGLCMRLRNVRLVTCRCFYDWGPCDINNPAASCAPDTNASKICHLPLTVHKMRQLSWFDGWWKLLSAREPAALAALAQWQAAQG